MDKKISYEQDLALAHGRAIARSNQRRRTAAAEAQRKADAERERKDAELAERRLAARNGLELGTRVRGLEAHWRLEWIEGVVLEGDFNEGGFPILCDNGETRYVLPNRTTPA